MTPGQAQSLAVQAAAFFAGTDPVLLKLRENAVFSMDLRGARTALRLHRRGYQTAQAIRSELWWMTALADAGLCVPRPVPTLSGDPLAALPDGTLASALTWIDGVPLGEGGVPLPQPPAEQARLHHALGQSLARLHDATDRLTLPPGFIRPSWDRDGLVGETPFWGRFWDHPGATPDDRALLRRTRDTARNLLGEYVSVPADQGLIHADVLRENVLIDGTKAALIDFDDCGFGFRLYDLGTALSQCLSEPALPDIAAAFTDGYASIRPLSARDRAMLPWMTLLRCTASVGWMVPRLPPDDPRHRTYIARATWAARILLDGDNLFAPPGP